jgi:methyl-accepting chemotaxis protein
MRALSGRLTIRHKLWLGYGLILSLFALAAFVAVGSLAGTQGAVRIMVQEAQPAALDALAFSSRIENASAELGHYLLTNEPGYQEGYTRALGEVGGLLASLAANPRVASDAELRASVDAIGAGFAQLESYRERFVELTQDQSANFPAFQIASERLNPVGMQMLQLTSEMILSEEAEPADEERKRLLMTLGELRYAWVNVLSGVRSYISFRDETWRNNLDLYRENVYAVMQRVQTHADIYTFEQEDAMAQFESLIEDYFASVDELLRVHGSERWRTDAYLIRSEVGPLMRRLQDELHAVVGRLRDDIEVTSTDLLAETQSTRWFVLVLAGAGLLAGLAAAVLIGRAISRPLSHAVEAMRDIAQGEGDLTRRLDVDGRDEVAEMAVEFNLFVDKIHALVADVTGSVSQLAAAAEEMSVITSETSEGVDRQQAETGQVASAVHEMNATAQEVARSATQAAGSAKSADDEAGLGREVVGQAVSSIDALAGEVERAAKVIQRLEQDSDQIGTVLEVIRSIAEQTNLLALNAAIEAARAGEQGRGFAVVADEVRSLASRTQESTEEVNRIIEQLQGGTREAARVMEQSRVQAAASVEQASRAGASLDAIASAVGDINEMNAQIASAAEEQNAVSEEVTRSVNRISDVSQQSADGTRQLKVAAEQLAALSGRLQSMVGQFKIDHG